MFLIFCFWACRNASSNLSVPPPYPQSRKDFISKILSRLERIRPENQKKAVEDFLSGWCMGAPIGAIRRGNISQFLAWAMYAARPSELGAEDLAEIDTFFERLEKVHGIFLQPGFNPKVKACTLSLDPVSFLPRPMLVYISISALDVFKHLILTLLGFIKCRSSSDVIFWYRPSASGSTRNPMAFFHGIAPCGQLFYLPLILSVTGGGALFLFSNEGVDMSMSLSAPSEDAVTSAVEEAASKYEPGKHLTLVGHSLGSCPCTWLLRRPLSVPIAQLVLLDPVTLYLSHPAVAVNFVYKTALKGFMERVIYYGASTELYIAHYLKRNFWWYRNEMWLEDIPSSIPVSVFLSKSDEIVDCELVARGLRKQREMGEIGDNVEIIELDGGHARMIAEPSTWRLIRAQLLTGGEVARKEKCA